MLFAFIGGIILILLFFVFIFLIPILDAIFKILIKNNLSVGDTIDTFSPFLKITYIKNFGAAFGIFQGGKYFFILVSIAVITLMFYNVLIKKPKSKLFLLACSFLIGGGIGNLIDRIFTGFVIDYLKLTFFPPVCNLSDYFISVGSVLLILYFLKSQKD